MTNSICYSPSPYLLAAGKSSVDLFNYVNRRFTISQKNPSSLKNLTGHISRQGLCYGFPLLWLLLFKTNTNIFLDLVLCFGKYWIKLLSFQIILKKIQRAKYRIQISTKKACKTKANKKEIPNIDSIVASVVVKKSAVIPRMVDTAKATK